MATDCNPNSSTKEVFCLIVLILQVHLCVGVAPNVTAKAEVSRLVCGLDSTNGSGTSRVCSTHSSSVGPLLQCVGRGRGAGKC